MNKSEGIILGSSAIPIGLLVSFQPAIPFLILGVSISYSESFCCCFFNDSGFLTAYKPFGKEYLLI
jgi:hypothetical protein